MNLYYIFYKPYGVVGQFSGEGQRNLQEFGFPKDIYPCGRLDKDSEGLLLLTNDGPLIHRLLDPKFKSWKTYYVQVEGRPNESDLEKLRQGVVIKGRKTRPSKVKIMHTEPDLPNRDPPIRFRKNIPTTWLEIKLCEGRNRQVRRMTAKVGHPTLRLCRYQMAGLILDGLKLGEFRKIDRKCIIC